jgi:hypothetical protein
MKSETINGDEISSYVDGFPFALTNPTHTSPRGFEWSRKWSTSQAYWRSILANGIEYKEKWYKDVEEAYQKNKLKFPLGAKRNKFMLDLLVIKLKTYPILVEEIESRGGLHYLQKCTHSPTKKKSYWETTGENMFIVLLCEAYSRIITKK